MKRWICLLLILVCLPVGGALGEEPCGLWI